MESIDDKLRKAFPDSMREGIQIEIKKVCGFEMFGAYETWDSGYIVTIPGREYSDKWYLEEDKLGRREITSKDSSLEKAVNDALFQLNNLKICSICGYLFHTKYKTTKCPECYFKE